jgi:hypothetical protein
MCLFDGRVGVDGVDGGVDAEGRRTVALAAEECGERHSAPGTAEEAKRRLDSSPNGSRACRVGPPGEHSGECRAGLQPVETSGLTLEGRHAGVERGRPWCERRTVADTLPAVLVGQDQQHAGALAETAASVTVGRLQAEAIGRKVGSSYPAHGRRGNFEKSE